MGFGFFKRKKTESLTLDEAEIRVLNALNSAKRSIEPFISEKRAEMRAEIDSLVSALEMLDVDAVHPRLRSQTRNFVSVMLNLWKTELDGSSSDIFLEASKKLEKVAVLKVKYFRMLFAVNPPEIEQVDHHLRNIASIIADVGTRRKEAGIEGLENALRLIEDVKRLLEERNRARCRISGILSELDRAGTDMTSEERETDGLLAGLRAEVVEVEREICRIEGEISRKIAHIKKPIRLYAHMVGERVDADTHRLLGDMDDLKRLASGALSEIKKGNIKLKEKRQNAIIEFLEEITGGKLESDLERLAELRERLRVARREVKKLELQDREHNLESRKEELEKRLASAEELVKNLNEEVEKARHNLESVLSVLWGCEVRLQIVD